MSSRQGTRAHYLLDQRPISGRTKPDRGRREGGGSPTDPYGTPVPLRYHQRSP